jgi:hypothetical protein
MAKNRDLSKLANRLTVDNNYNVGISGSLTVTGSIISTVTTLWSGSAQLPSGVVSGSAQTIANLPSGTVSGSAQVDVMSTTNIARLATTGSNTFQGNQTVNGSLVVTGSLTAQQFIVSSSVTYLTTSFSSGSTKFGDSSDDTHQFTGSVRITGSLTTTSTADAPMIFLENINSSSYSQIQFKGDTKHAYIFKGNSTYGSYGGANALNFYTDSVSNGFAWHPIPNTNAMVLSQAGNLGLNVGVSPTNLLHLAGASATPSLRLGSVSTGYHWDIGRENATTGDFLFNYTANGTFAGTFARITTAGLFGIGVTASGTYGKLSVAGGIRTIDDNNSKLELGRYSAANPYSYIKLGTNATSLRISNASDGADLFYFTNGGNLGIGRDATRPLDVYASDGGALVYLQNTNTLGYSGIDIFRQTGTHAGSVWCANDTAAASNNRNALTISARVAGEKVIIVGGGYDPTITGGFEVKGAVAKLYGSTAYHHVNSTAGLYCYLFLDNTAGGAGNERSAYFIQNTYNQTSNGVAAGAAYLYFGQGQNMEFSWAGTTKITFTSGGSGTFVGGVTSDRRTKENISLITDNTLSFINELKPVSYQFISDKTKKTRRGFIAQDVLETSIPSLVLGNGELEDGTYGLDYDGVLALTVKAIQELKVENDNLKDILTRNNLS